MTRTARSRPDSFRPKLLALSVAACFSLSSAQSLANPTGGTVSSGSASFASSGNTLTITNSANTIINWGSFSIGVNEITQFLQSSSGSAVLNRVVGSGGVIPQSVIDGVLSSNGRVFLLNSSGIVIGSTGRIDVAGFVASSLNLSDQDFQSGKLRFTDTPGAGKVSNAGVIDTSAAGPGGRVFLIGPDVQNSGLIRSPQGQIVLAAGKSVELISEGSPFVTVNISADSEQALNVGQLIADSGRIGMFGALVRQGGVVEANSAVVGENGEIRLIATRDLTLDAGSRTTANGPSGGTITLQAQGGTNLISGTVEATGSSGQGGTIHALGVRVGVIGHGVIDASGDTGGGTVLIGGDFQGNNPDIQNAERTLIGPDGIIRADAGTSGDGGRVIVWSDSETRAFGSISAQGGAQSGNGGFVETSSHGGMDITGIRVDTRAPNGTWGTWLLDPVDVTIIYGAAGAVGTEPITNVSAFLTPAVYGGLITSGTIEANFLTVGTTSIQATNNVNFQTDLNLTYGTLGGGLFEVRAVNNIDLATHTITTNGHNVVLSANDNGDPLLSAGLNMLSGTGSIIGGGNIITGGGAVTLSGVGITVGAVNSSSPIGSTIGPGSVNMLSSSDDITTGSITTRSLSELFSAGNVTLTTDAGNITVNGTIDTRGVDGALSFRSSNGGNVTLRRGSSTVAGSVTVNGDILTYGGANPNGGSGNVSGLGGDVTIYGGVDAFGAALPMYGAVVVAPGAGNIVTGGGDLAIVAGAGVTTGNINTSPPAAGNTHDFGRVGGYVAISAGLLGGAGDISTGSITTRSLHSRYDAGSVTLQVAEGRIIVNGMIDTRGANGTTTSVDMCGDACNTIFPSGSRGGDVILIRTGVTDPALNPAVQVSGSILTYGGNGTTNTDPLTPSSIPYGAGGYGGSGGGVSISAGLRGIAYGGITVSGSIDTHGGNGADSLPSSGLNGGNGGGGGFVGMDGTAIATGPITTRGGSGGNGGSAPGSLSFGGNGGSGGAGGVVFLTGSSSVNVSGAIDISGGAGGSGGSADPGYGGIGGIGGGAAGSILPPIDQPAAAPAQATTPIFSGLTIFAPTVTVGPITALGGAGGAGGSGGGRGGFGGDGALVFVEGFSITGSTPTTTTFAGGTVTVGDIDASGGAGGAGGSGGGNGGVGGDGGFVLVFGSPIFAGAITARGGAGGAATGAGTGGNGGYGGVVALESFSSESISTTTAGTTTTDTFTVYGGALTVGNIDVSGGSGGSGSFGALPAGIGGGGGSALLFGSSITAGTIAARGGSGGAGGASDGISPAGSGGDGGGGGDVMVAALSVSSSATTTDNSTVPPTVTPVPGTLTNGTLRLGAIDVSGGAGGVAGGPSPASAGQAGSPGSTSILGNAVSTNLVGQVALGANTAIQETNQLTQTERPPTAEDIEKKEKEKDKINKAGAVCK